MDVRARWQDWRRRLREADDAEARQPLWSLFYLLFLFINWNGRPLLDWLPATLLSVGFFLPAYFVPTGGGRLAVLARTVAIALLGALLVPVNTGANTYLIYAAAVLPRAGLPLRRAMALVGAGIGLFAVELVMLGWPGRFILMELVITSVVATAICAANHYEREKHLRQAELALSHEEVRRLAALAERERIGRDLHDLLGHTLSLITLKAGLAARLSTRDPAAAQREIGDVERIARDALAQVRRAVSGIRTAGLHAEAAAARLLLESAGMQFAYQASPIPLAPAAETVLALTLREAAMNAQRHSGARHVRAAVTVAAGEVRLEIGDDGHGGPIVPGNGLAGMRERLQACGGGLFIDPVPGRGTLLVACIPPPAATATVMGAGGGDVRPQAQHAAVRP
jgi:two-component system sensor histidine kinase DesK